MKIILIRHGDYPEHTKNTTYELHELGLSAKGIVEIAWSAGDIKHIIKDKKIKIISSDAQRAKDTAIIISDILSYKEPIIFECNLQEYRFDDTKPFNYNKYTEIVTTKFKEYNCENPAKLFFRAFGCIKRHIDSNIDFLIVSTHAGVIMAFLGILSNKGMLSIQVNNGAYIILDESFFI